MEADRAHRRAASGDAAVDDSSPLDAAPGLARIAAGAWLRTAEWTASTTLRAGRRLSRAALSGESPVSLLRDVRTEVLEGTRRMLGVNGIDEPLSKSTLGSDDGREGGKLGPLRERGAELLERSASLAEHGDAHPAYTRILDELSPDEARILRLIATEGPQPAIDVRTWRPLDIGSRVVAPGLSMIGPYAGVLHPDRVPAYLSNLFRLGLIWFSREQLRDPAPYQVLEAQPHVIEAIREAGRARIVRRSLALTPFGSHFCEFCLPFDTAEFEAISVDAAGSPAVSSDASGSPA